MKSNRGRIKQGILYGGAYLVIFGLFFLQYPLKDSLTGELDTVGNLALFKMLRLWVEGVFTGVGNGSTNYPSEHVWAAIGADFGSGVIYLFFEWLGFNEVWANALFITFIFTLNSLSLFYFIRLYISDTFASFIGALFFTFSQFMLGSLEHPNAIIFFLCFTSLYLFKRYLRTYKLRDILLTGLVGGIQIYLSPYVFLFYGIMLFILFLWEDKNKHLVHYIITILLGLAIISPYIYYFLLDSPVKGYFNPITSFGFVHIYSLNLDDLLRVLPNHLLFTYRDEFSFPLIAKIKSAYVGVVFWGLAIMGSILLCKKREYMWATMAVVGTCIALGPYVVLDSQKLMPAPMWPLYEYANFGSILRIPLRAFFITLISFSILTANSIQYILSHWQRGKYVVVLLTGIFIIENVPFPMEKYQQKTLLHPDPAFIEILKSSPAASKVVMHLPSGLFGFKNDKREYTYMYWQSFHRQNIVNGSLGVFPLERLKNDSLMKTWSVPGHMDELVAKNKIDYIVYHMDMEEEDIDTANFLAGWKQFDYLQPIAESDRSIVFKVRKTVP